jgi:hypothetical protein
MRSGIVDPETSLVLCNEALQAEKDPTIRRFIISTAFQVRGALVPYKMLPCMLTSILFRFHRIQIM